MKWLIGIIAYTLGITSTPPVSMFSSPVVPNAVVNESREAENQTSASIGVIKTPGGHPIVLEWATSSIQSERGLSGRAGVEDGAGMIFDFKGEEEGAGIWMKDMLFPIDVVWLSPDFEIVEILPNISPETYPYVFEMPVGARYALEVSAGFAEKINLKIKDRLVF